MMIIGLVGPEESCKLIEKGIHSIDSQAEVKCYMREPVRASIEVIEECENECDAIIFTGCAISNFIKDNHEIKKPHTFIARTVSSVAEAFIKMLQHNMELDAFSIDVVEKQMVEDLLDAFHIQPKNIYTSSFQPGVEESEYVNWHLKLRNDKKTDVALTSFVAVYHALEEQGCPVFYLAPTRENVRDALDNISKECALTKAEYSQIAIELMQLTNYDTKKDTYYSNMLSKAEFEPHLIKYVKGVQGSVFPFGRNEYIIFSNSGTIKNNCNYTKLSQLQSQAREFGIFLNIGIGMGTTAFKADINARKALEHSLKKGQREIFKIDEENILEGPLGKDIQLQYSMISLDPEILNIAKKTGLSTESILKIKAIAEVRKSYVFDAHELAECLEVTVRSARRILNKIVAAGCGSIYAKESSAAGGRPKALIELLFK